MKNLIFIPVILCATTVLAETKHREHDAHVHGHAELKIAWSNKELIIELESPAMNLTGFEHQAESKKDKHTLNEVVEQLNKADQLIMPTQAANCALISTKIESALLEHDDHDKHNHDKHDDHNDHKDHDKHNDHDDHGDESVHSEFEVALEFKCHNPDELQSIDMKGLFKSFSRLKDLDVEWVSDNQQGAAELSSSNTRLSLR